MVTRLSFPVLLFHLLSVLLLLQGSARAISAPTQFALTWAPSGLLTASWKDQSSSEEGFYLAYRVGTSGAFTGYDSVGANVLTYSYTPATYPSRTTFQWVVYSYKGTGANYEEAASNTVTVTSPPRLTNEKYAWAMAGQPFSMKLKTDAATPAYTVTSLPAGLTYDAASTTISGTLTTNGRYTADVTITSGTATGTQKLRFVTFRPVPEPVAPSVVTPFAGQTLRKNATPLQVDLTGRFNDPDVTQASRIVYNTGTVDLIYYPDAAPASVANFQGYISRGDYLNSIIHRVPNTSKFVVQGGGYKAAAGTPSITRAAAVVNEPEITNTRGTVAMAKLGSDPNSATCEYFFNLADNASNLNGQNEGFTVFARVAGNGMTVVDGIYDLPNKDYSSVNSVLTNCPVTLPAPAAFDPASLVKIISIGPVNLLSYTVQSSAPAVCTATLEGTKLTLTPLAAGTAIITVTAKDLDNLTAAPTFTVNVNENLSDWLTGSNFPVPADATAGADADKDNVPNILEYAFLTDPLSPASQASPQAATTTVEGSNYLTLTFPVRKFTGTGFVYTVEAGDGTGAWATVWNSSTDGLTHALVTTSTDHPASTDVTVRDTAAITPGAKRFMRLRVTDTP